MKVVSNLLISLIVAFWVVAIAILSVQNATPVALRFITFQSINLPVGLVLGFSVGIGIIVGAIAPLLWQMTATLGEPSPSREGTEDNDEDF